VIVQTAAAISALSAGVLVPICARIATRLDLLDHPTGAKCHARPTPYLGGLAVVVALMATSALWPVGPGHRAAVLFGMGALCLVGTLDDRFGLSPGSRLLAEAAIAGQWWLATGPRLTPSPAVDCLLAIAWVLIVVNAVNLSDNMDGICGSLLVAMGAGIAAAWAVEAPSPPVVAVALTAAAAGFLVHNLRRPARVFLGDGGTMPLGFLLAVLAFELVDRGTSAAHIVPAVPLLLAVPLTDTVAVVIWRGRRGVSVATGGQDHLSHRLAVHLGEPHRVAALMAGVQAFCCAIAVALIAAPLVLGSALIVSAAGIAAVLWLTHSPRLTLGTFDAANRPLRK
jgi:UDP-GlcNAc:undecaprenyl-phosphate GlcNAc-1-phosphate transferase